MAVYPKVQDVIKTAENMNAPDPKGRPVKKFFDWLVKPLQINARLMGHFITRTSGLLSYDWNISGDYANIEKVQARLQPAIEFILSNCAYAPLFRSNLFPYHVTNNELGSVITITERLPNNRYDVDYPNIHIFNSDGSYDYSFSVLETEGYILDLISHLPKGGLMKSIIIYEIFRMDAIVENANYLKKLKGILQIINKSGSKEDEAAAEYAGKTAIQDNYIITSQNVEFVLNEIAQAAGSNFKDFLQFLNNEISIAVLGQANTSELPNSGGSRAALQIQKLISADLFYSDMIRIEQLINRLLLLDYRLNVQSDANKAPYRFAFELAEEIDLEQIANSVETITRVIPLRREEVYKRLGFTPPGEGDEIIGAATL